MCTVHNGDNRSSYNQIRIVQKNTEAITEGDTHVFV